MNAWAALGQAFSNTQAPNDLWNMTGLGQRAREEDYRRADKWAQRSEQRAVKYGIDAEGRAVRYQTDAEKRALANQLQFERTGIGARVEGAKAAGIHPLAALGMQASGPIVSSGVSASAPGPSDVRPPSGGGGGGAALPFDTRTPEQRRYDAAQADLAELQVAAAQQRLGSQPGEPPLVQVEPDQVIAHAPSEPHRTAGTHPGTSRVNLPFLGAVDVVGGIEALQDSPVAAILTSIALQAAANASANRRYTDEAVRMRESFAPKGDHDYTHLVRRNRAYPRRMGAAGPQYYGERYRHY